MNFFEDERRIVDKLKTCLEHCVVQGVPDYWWIQLYGAEKAKFYKSSDVTKAGVFVFYGGEQISSSRGCCITSKHLWVIAVVTSNQCDKVNNGMLAREENGNIVAEVICCMHDFCNAGCATLTRVTVPQFPIPLDDNGIVTTFLAYTIERADAC